SGYIQLGKVSRPIEPRDTERHLSVFQKLEGLLGVQHTAIARCFECPGKREVPGNATSTICPQCGAYIDLQDYKIEGNYSRSIRTRGKLIISSKGDLNSNRVICETAEIYGFMRGSLICSGDVRIRFKGKLSGSIEAKNVHIDKKCEAEFVRPIRVQNIEIEGSISARIISTGKVNVLKTGKLTGAVQGRGFNVERGGEFFGEVSMGKVDMVQGELLVSSQGANIKTPGSPGPGNGFSLASA
ncbi:MAG: polymer-forming cytoskeletal protein, partial [Verrucomicrobia bacterium]|nr:polymer-forming cytoskeletal protein [Verrucomicrobiota bacterium]